MIKIEDLVRQCILARKEYIPGKPIEEVQREYGLTDIIKMASNENPLGTSPLAVDAMVRELTSNANRYPESLCHDLLFRLADYHHLDADQLFIDNGLDGVITMLGLTFINPGDEVIYGSLSFPAYENITTKMDGKCVPVKMTRDYRIDTKGILAAVSPKTKVIFLCNPNNPTGTINTKAEFEQLLFNLPESVLLVVDEAYYDFVDDPEYPNTVEYLSDHPNIVILRTFSKIMGMAGLRIGYAIGDKRVIKPMYKAREPFPVNRIAQAGALASLDDVDFRKKTLDVNKQGRDQFSCGFREMGLEYYPSQSNFVFVDIGQPTNAVFESMLRDGVIVRPVNSPEAKTCLRISIGTSDENTRTLRSLAKALGIATPILSEN